MEHTLPAVAAFIGIDWADQKHDIALLAAGATAIEMHSLPHEPHAIHAWVHELTQRFGGQPVAIAIETSRGPLVHALLEHPIVRLYPINPRSVQRYREAFSPSGAKDDQPDARLLLNLLQHHRAQLPLWRPSDAATRELGRLVQVRRTAVNARTRLGQQLQAALKEYFPQALTLGGEDHTSPMACAFLAKWPTLEAVQRARPTTIERFYTTHGCRSATRRAQYLSVIRETAALTTDPAIIASSVLHVQLLAAQLTTIAAHLQKIDAAITQQFAAHPDAALFTSFPGAGAALAPRLLVAFGTDRTRYATATEVQQLSGIAPVLRRSGRTSIVQARWSAPVFLRQTFHEHAQQSIRHCDWAHTYYATQRARGKSHHTAVRALAYKWIRILWRCWQDRTPYDDACYVRALQHRARRTTATSIDCALHDTAA